MNQIRSMSDALHAYEQAEIAIRNCSKAEREEYYRKMLMGDLFYFILFGLKREDIARQWLYSRCREVEVSPDGHLDLWARAHYKSTIITYALTIQEILKNPNVTIGIFSHTRPIAKQFLRQIKREFEANVVLKNHFKDILYQVPQKQSPKWSEDDGIIPVMVDNITKECTVEAWGLVDGQPISKHFDILIYDDVVTRESVNTPEMIAKTTEALQLSFNLGTEHPRKRFIGTRYHFGDTYKTIIDGKIAIPRIYPATIDGTINGEPVLLTRAQLREKYKEQGIFTFSAQMLQNPKADTSQGFQEAWLRYWPALNTENMNLYILCDPANAKKRTSDYTAFMVVGCGPDGNYYVADMIRDRMSLTERANALFNLHKKYKPLGVGYEKYGKDADISHYEDRMNRESYRFEITALGGTKMSKEDRIKQLVPLFEEKRIYIPERCIKTNFEKKPEDLTQIFVQDEFKAFPVSTHDDMLDALARIKDEDFPMQFPVSTVVEPLTPAEEDYYAIMGMDPAGQGGESCFTMDEMAELT